MRRPFYTMASYALLGTDVTTGNADAYLPYFAEGGAMQAYKQLFNLPTCVERFAALGLDVGTMDDRIPAGPSETVAAEVESARATRATQRVTDAADEATYTPGYILHHLLTALLFVQHRTKRRPLPAHAGRRQPKLLHAGPGLVLGGGALPAAGLRGAARPKRKAAYGQAAGLWRGGGRPELPCWLWLAAC